MTMQGRLTAAQSHHVGVHDDMTSKCLRTSATQSCSEECRLKRGGVVDDAVEHLCVAMAKA